MRFLISDDERELDLLSNANIRLLQDGLEMPLVARELTYAESADSEGRRRVRSKNQNAEGRVGVIISGTSDSHFWDNVDNLVEVVESCHRNRGSIVYQPPGGTLVNWDVESITVTGLPQPGIELRRRRQQAEVTFEVQPYGRLTEVTLSTGGTIDGPIGGVTVSSVPGQVDAFGLLTLTDASTQTRQFVEVGVQHDFNPSSPEPLLLTAGTMAGAGGTLTGLSAAAGTASRPTGAYTTSSGNSFTLQSVVDTNAVALATTSARPHKGLWKVRTRVQSNATSTLVRLAWRVGNGPWSREQWRSVPNSGIWHDIDLGTIDIPQLSGTHSWEGRVETIAQTGTATVNLDTVSFIPCDTYTKLRGSRTQDTGVVALVASDDFSTLSGTLSGGTVGYTASGTVTWSTSGATGDFTVDTTNDWLTRNQGGDAAVNTGRYARVGVQTLTGISAQARIFAATGSNPTSVNGLFARWTDANNWVMARYTFASGFLAGIYRLQLLKRVSSTVTTLGTYDVETGFIDITTGPIVNGFNDLRLDIDTSGRAIVYSNGQAVISVTDSDLATGGPLATGGYGIYHANTGTASTLDRFDNFTVRGASSALLVNPALYSSRTLNLSHQEALSASSDGTVNNPTPIVEGNYLRLPPATRASNQHRVVVRARRDDVDAGFADTGLTDRVTATIKATPRVTIK